MVCGFVRVSWLCLLLFSSTASFPATKEDYRYPYTATWSAAGGPAPGSSVHSGVSRQPLASLLHEAAPQQYGNQSPSNVAAVSSQSYEPNKLELSSGSSYKAPSRTPEGSDQSFVQPQPGGAANVGSVYRATSSGFSFPAGNSATGDNVNSAGKGPSGTPEGPYQSFVQPQPGGAARVESGYEVPSSNLVYPAGNTAPRYGLGYGSVSYPEPSTSFGLNEVTNHNAPAPYGFAAPVSYGYEAPPGLPWAAQPAGGADSSYNPADWMPSGNFPDFTIWGSSEEIPQSLSETSPLPPSSYIIQSRNGYQRAREVLSHSKYSPEYPEPPVSPFQAAQGGSRTAAAPGSKGGKCH